jgi:murein peptide amidase A
MGRMVAALVAALTLATVALNAGAGARGDGSHEFGVSLQGRDLRALALAPGDRPRTVLVVGSIHGDEREGHEVVRRLRSGRGPEAGAALWTVRSLNPDGVAAERRGNARGVDLNRNFPYRWRYGAPPGDGYYQGPDPASEPETRAAMRLIRRLEPDVTVWYHQPWGLVPAPCRGPAAAERLYARIARMDLERCRAAGLRGTATSWQEKRVGGTAFGVELAAGELGDAEVRRHARALTRVANRLAGP